MIFTQAALGEDRIITTNINSLHWKIIHQSPQVSKAAKSLYLPLTLRRVSKEARKAMFAASTSHIFVDNHSKVTGEVRKLCFRPNDLLYIEDLSSIGQRLYNPYIRFREKGFGEGIRHLVLQSKQFEWAKQNPTAFIVCLRSFLPDLKVVYVVELVPNTYHCHLCMVYDGTKLPYIEKRNGTVRSIEIKPAALLENLGPVVYEDLVTKKELVTDGLLTQADGLQWRYLSSRLENLN